MKSQRNLRRGLLFLSPALVFVALFFVLPVAMMFQLSLVEWNPNKPDVLVWFANYLALFQDGKFLQSFYNTLLYTAIVTPMLVLTSFFFALALRRSTRMNVCYRVIFFLPFTISMVAASFIWIWLLNDTNGVLNFIVLKIGLAKQGINFFATQMRAMGTVAVMINWKAHGMTMIILLAGLSAIPYELYEAAAMDGAGRIKVFLLVTLPMLRSTLVLALILSLAGSFRAFDQFYVMTNGQPLDKTLTVLMYINRVGFEYFEVGKSSAASTIFSLVLFGVSLLQLKVGRYGRD